MTRIAVLRPEPGNAATRARVAAAGLVPLPLPLFAVRPLAWEAPDRSGFDALLLTSANAARHGGAGLAVLASLPVIAVGEATAAAARAAGLQVIRTGEGDAASVVARFAGRLLHLAGREHMTVVPDAIAVYAAEPLPISAAELRRLDGGIALLHSARAARRLATLVESRAAIRLACLSPQVAAAAGDGWGELAVADVPTDAALLDAARAIDR